LKSHFKYLLELLAISFESSVCLLIKTANNNHKLVDSFTDKSISDSNLSKLVNSFTIDDSLNEYKITLQNELAKETNIAELEVFKIYSDEFETYHLIYEPFKKHTNELPSRNIELIKKGITERIEYNSSINQKYIETTSNVSTVIYSTNSAGTEYNFISNSVERLFGLKPEEIINNKLKLLRSIKKEYFKGYTKFIRSLKEGKKGDYEYQINWQDGKTTKWVKHTGTPIIVNNKVERVVGIIDDITEQKSILNKLGKSEEKFRQLIETANDLIISLNSFGYVSLVNKNGIRSLGLRPDEVLGKHFLELVDETTKEETIDAFQKILSSENVTNFEATLVDKFENPVLFDFQAVPTKDGDVISGLLAIGRDITRKRIDENKMQELNTKLIEANRLISIERDRAKQQLTVLEELNKLKNDFVSRISHELRTPLASIVGFAETIVSDEDLPADMMMEFNNIILTEGKRLAKLVNDVLDFSKLESLDTKINKESIDVIALLKNVKESLTGFAEEKAITINFELPEAEIIIFADREILNKAIEDLVENGIKFNQPGGRVTILAQDFLNEVEIIISDTGIGIAEEELPSLFEKFTQFDSNTGTTIGAGLGLAYVKQVIDLHRGLIQVKSELGSGTTFIIRLPKKK
jgi:PAS domain S-box-containing protein